MNKLEFNKKEGVKISRRAFLASALASAVVAVSSDAQARCLPSLGTCDRKVRAHARRIDRQVNNGAKAKVSRKECNRLSRQMDYEAPQYREAIRRCKAKFGSYENMDNYCKRVCANAFRKNRFFGRMWWQCYRAGFAPRPSGVYANPKKLLKWNLREFIKYVR